MSYPHNGSLVIPEGLNESGSSTTWRAGEPTLDITATDLQSNAYKYEKEAADWGCVRKLVAQTHLFMQQPSIEDVLQADLGDCFLLSSLIAILGRSGGPQLIESMMTRDEEEDAVVRLYVPFSTSTPPPADAGQARYVTVRWSKLCKANGEPAGTPGALWVHILEKAYAGFNNGALFQGQRGSFLRLNVGGYAKVALEILLGKQSVQDKLSPEASPQNEYVQSFLKLMRGTDPSFLPDALMTPALWTLFNDWKAKNQIRYRWDNFYYDRDPSSTSQRNTHLTPIRLEHIAKFLQESGCPKEILDLLMVLLTSKKVFPGKRFTGNYLQQEIDRHEAIKTALAGGASLVAEANLHDDPTASSSSTASNVHEAKGLGWKHCYALLANGPSHILPGVAQPEDPSNPPPEGALPESLRGVWMCNPWRDTTGRVYRRKADGNVTAEGAPERVFWLELADLTKRFEFVDTNRP